MMEVARLLVFVSALVAVASGCEPGEEWTLDCNRCYCSDKGRPVCSRRLCGTGIQLSKRESQRSCQPGEEWTMDCNRCYCSDDGGPVCTRRLCGTEHGSEINLSKRETQPKCKPGEEWTMDCNRCHCTDDGGAICTKRLCGTEHGTHVKISKRETQKKCTPGEEWQDNCRWCMCEDDGTPSCGKISCNFGSVPGMARRKRRSPYPIPTVSKPKRGCTPGSRWKDECDNNCFCNERGVAICTEKGCIRH